MRCPKCSADMAEGFQLDSGHHNSRQVASWVSGKPQKSFWAGISFKGVTRIPIQVHRCTSCGFLESYARS
jgi:uncharacterized protein with PIN domain